MKKEQGKKSRLLQMILKDVRKTAVRGAGIPSHKGIFEPKTPEKLLNFRKKERGYRTNEDINRICGVSAVLSVLLLLGVEWCIRVLL